MGYVVFPNVSSKVSPIGRIVRKLRFTQRQQLVGKSQEIKIPTGSRRQDSSRVPTAYLLTLNIRCGTIQLLVNLL